jgi:hypothetical protein
MYWELRFIEIEEMGYYDFHKSHTLRKFLRNLIYIIVTPRLPTRRCKVHACSARSAGAATTVASSRLGLQQLEAIPGLAQGLSLPVFCLGGPDPRSLPPGVHKPISWKKVSFLESGM